MSVDAVVAAAAVVGGNDEVVEACPDGESVEEGLDEEPEDEGNVEEDHAGNLVVEANGSGGADQIVLDVLVEVEVSLFQLVHDLVHVVVEPEMD
jgi:hypothetical protein